MIRLTWAAGLDGKQSERSNMRTGLARDLSDKWSGLASRARRGSLIGKEKDCWQMVKG